MFEKKKKKKVGNNGVLKKNGLLYGEDCDLHTVPLLRLYLLQIWPALGKLNQQIL